MSIRHIGNGVTVILLLICVLLSTLIYQQWVKYAQTGPFIEVSQEQPTNQNKTTSNLFLDTQSKSILISQFSEILARPLFTEGRLPAEQPEPEKVVIEQVGLPNLKLEGVVISSESRVALVRDLTNNELIRLTQGMIHGGWRVTTVNNAEATLEHEGETHKLPLELENKPGTKSTTSRFRLPPIKKQAKPRPK